MSVPAKGSGAFEDQTETGEMANVEIEGNAILNKIDETPEVATWSFDQLQILDNKVEFSEPIKITAGAGELEGPSSSRPESNKKEENR